MATTASVTVDPARIARLIRLPGGLVDRDLRRRAERVAVRARSTAPGSMRERISVELEGTGRGRRARIILNHPAAVYVTQGTRPHIIRPRRAMALRFRYRGRVVFAQRVNHPGNQPNDFMRRALAEAR